jgi:ATP-dependent DNA helicase PIF1
MSDINSINLASLTNIILSPEQQIAFDRFLNGDNLFICGPGGTGKSVLVKLIYQHAITQGRDIQVCALTGCAAILLQSDARTIHSWSGIGIANAPIPDIVKKISESNYYKGVWEQIEILIIDEVSMMSCKIFDLLNAIGQVIRNDQRPFGGIQVIFCGDFNQLPPVATSTDPDTAKFCFESKDWDLTFDSNIELKHIFRQNDPTYIGILNEIRLGTISKDSQLTLMNCIKKKVPADFPIKPTKLYPNRGKVDAINNWKLNKLDGNEFIFEQIKHYDLKMNAKERAIKFKNRNRNPLDEIKYLESNLMCVDKLSLKVGAQVMCIINIDNLCNGSQGVITGFSIDKGLPIVKFTNGVEKTMDFFIWKSEFLPDVGISQIPLILSWALTIHKSQGMSLDMAEIDIGSSIFECGQTYVALSRVKSLDGLYLKSFDPKKVLVNSKVKKFNETKLGHTPSIQSNYSNQSKQIIQPTQNKSKTNNYVQEQIPDLFTDI